jgi:hypothetical protein
VKKVITAISAGLILLLAVGYIFIRSLTIPPVEVSEIKQLMVSHLAAQGYSPPDYQLEVTYLWEARLFGQDPYPIQVTFKDEQDVIYGYKYYYRSTKEIIQSGAAPLSERTDKNFKHAEPDA